MIKLFLEGPQATWRILSSLSCTFDATTCAHMNATESQITTNSTLCSTVFQLNSKQTIKTRHYWPLRKINEILIMNLSWLTDEGEKVGVNSRSDQRYIIAVAVRMCPIYQRPSDWRRLDIDLKLKKIAFQSLMEPELFFTLMALCR